MLHARSLLWSTTLSLSALLPLTGCKTGSATPTNGAGLPVPPGLRNGGQVTAATSQAGISRYLSPGQKQLDLTPLKTIHMAFALSPQIRASYLRYSGEKARYDYIMATWTSTTPGVAAGPGWVRTEDPPEAATNRQTQRVEGFVERNFLDTSRLRAFAGGLNEDNDESHALHPTAGGLLRFPLWGSREALQRSSEQIFQQTQVNDAQLAYVQRVRENLRAIGETFFAVLGIGQRVEAMERKIEDLRAAAGQAREAGKPAADLQRFEAEITTATTMLRSQQSNYAIEMAWMTSTMGLPRDLEVRLVDEPFNPFDGTPPEQLLALSLGTDPEIATLNNAIKDAEVQLALARKGKLDVAMSLAASADMAGSGTWSGQTEYRAETSLSVAFIDPRLSSSLAREASANIWQYQHAIQRRRNNVYLEANEPLIRFRMLAKNIPEQEANVARLRRDYETGLRDYLAGRMDVDDLVRRRQALLDGESDLSFSKANLGQSAVSLAAATGKMFELLQDAEAEGTRQQGTGDRLQGTAGNNDGKGRGARGTNGGRQVTGDREQQATATRPTADEQGQGQPATTRPAAGTQHSTAITAPAGSTCPAETASSAQVGTSATSGFLTPADGCSSSQIAEGDSE